MTPARIVPADLSHPGLRALIAAHHAHSVAHSPPESVHTPDWAALAAPDLALYALIEGGDLLAMGALKTLGPRDAELKAMHVAEAARGAGFGARMLDHLVATARAGGVSDLWLETGSMAAYAPARALYASRGFRACPPFGVYRPDPNSVFMRLGLRVGGEGPAPRAPRDI